MTHPTSRVAVGLQVLAFGLATGVVALGLLATEWPREQAFMAGIVVLAGVLWVTEAIPLFATAVLVIAAQVVLLANPGGWPGLGFVEAGAGPDLRKLLNAATDPVLVLFFAGFVMARAAVKEGVDQAMAAWLLRPFVRTNATLLAGVLGVTALFSMWMSNTATTAFMLTLVMPLVARLPEGDGARKALLLAVPFAANIGGLGTPIASPPNAIALGYLQRAGVSLGFLEWMLFAVPLVLVLLAFAWWVIVKVCRMEPGRAARLELGAPALTGRGRVVVAVFALTVALWVSEGLHGLPAAVVALLPLVLLVATGLIERTDVNRLDWDVLLLIAGGLALGYGLEATALDERVVAALPAARGFGLVLVMMGLTLTLSTFLSNTAVANLLLPVGLAAALAVDGDPQGVVIGIALAASLSMALPISTPPNAMAYATGEVAARDMRLAGAVVGLVGIAAAAAVLAWRG